MVSMRFDLAYVARNVSKYVGALSLDEENYTMIVWQDEL